MAHMNATAIAPKSSQARLNRIKTYGTWLGTIFILLSVAYLLSGFLNLFLNLEFKSAMPPDFSRLMNTEYFGKAVECWFAYKLFSGYASEGLFTASSIRWMWLIGISNVLTGLIMNIFRLRWEWPLMHWWKFNGDEPASWLLYMAELIQISLHYVDSHLLVGFVIIFIAWIMDEGRKMQEEQELTV
jgi:hypothetical protein